MKKKYTFTSETIKYKGYTLHRIKALKDIVINTEITIKKGRKQWNSNRSVT